METLDPLMSSSLFVFRFGSAFRAYRLDFNSQGAAQWRIIIVLGGRELKGLGKSWPKIQGSDSNPVGAVRLQSAVHIWGIDGPTRLR